MEQKQAKSYAWLIWLLVGGCLLVGWAVVQQAPSAQSGSQQEPSAELSQIAQIEKQQKPDNLQPVKQWLDRNQPQDDNQRAAEPAYSGYMTINDDLDTITLQVPKAWNDIDLGHWVHDGQPIGHFIMAADDLGRFESLEAESGVFMGVYAPHEHNDDGSGYQPLTLDEQLELLGLLQVEQEAISSQCDPEGRYGYLDMFYQGEYDFYVDCSQGSHQVLVISTKPTHESYTVLLRITITSRADIEAASQILDSYQVIGKPGKDHHEH